MARYDSFIVIVSTGVIWFSVVPLSFLEHEAWASGCPPPFLGVCVGAVTRVHTCMHTHGHTLSPCVTGGYAHVGSQGRSQRWESVARELSLHF